MNRTSIYRDRRVRSAALRRAVIGTERGQWCSLNIRGTAHTDQAARLAAADTIVAKLHAS